MSFPARRQLQIMAHRAKSPGPPTGLPENTLAAFSAAVAAGARLIETDLHLSQDGVLMISHDNSLLPAFGVKGEITASHSTYLRTLRTTKEPRQAMPMFRDFLTLLHDQMPFESPPVRLVLDIKANARNRNVAVGAMDEVMAAVAADLKAVDPDREGTFWRERIVVGCWKVDGYRASRRALPGIPVLHIGFKLAYAYEFLRLEGVTAFNIHYSHIATAAGRQFMTAAKEQGKEVFVWTVDDEAWIRWAVNESALDGVCTSEMGKVRQLEEERKPPSLIARYKMAVEAWVFRVLGLWFFFRIHGWNWEKRLRDEEKRV